MKTWILSLAILFGAFSAAADDYIAVAKNGNVYDQASAKYITENQNGDQVSVIPGMVFKTSQYVPGWYKIEYSPGLHAYIPEQIIATSFSLPKPGSYKVANNPSQSVSIQNSGDSWTINANGAAMNGSKTEDIVIFLDANGNPAFSLVDIGNGPVVISYDNNVTNFF